MSRSFFPDLEQMYRLDNFKVSLMHVISKVSHGLVDDTVIHHSFLKHLVFLP